MKVTLKNGLRKTVELECKKVTIEITAYRPCVKRSFSLKIKAKGKVRRLTKQGCR